jgi:hypothetical protein
MDNYCNITQLSDHISNAAQALARDIKHLQRLYQRCPDCQGYYCPVLLAVYPRVVSALQEIDDVYNQSSDER